MNKHFNLECRPQKYDFQELIETVNTVQQSATSYYPTSSSTADHSSSSDYRYRSVAPRTVNRKTPNGGFRTPLNFRTYASTSGSLRTGTSTTPRVSNKSVITAVAEGRGNARGEIGIASIDLKNPALILSQFPDNQAYVKLVTKLQILNPVEVILPAMAFENVAVREMYQQITHNFPDTVVSTVQRKYFNETSGIQYIRHLRIAECSSVEVEINSKYYCLAAAAALMKYVEFIQNVVYAPKSLKILFKGIENTMMIDAVTTKNLELLVNQCDPKSKETLFGVLNHTKTPGGAKLLRANLLQPSCDLDTIKTRLDCIEELTNSEQLFYNLQVVIGRFLDTEHLLSLCVQIPKQESIKSSDQKITNIIHLKHTLELVPALKSALEPAKNPLFVTYHQSLADPRFDQMLEKIREVIHEDTSYQKGALSSRTQKCFAIKPNINGLLDVARRTYTETIDDIVALVQQLSERHCLPLKVGYSAGRSFYVQCPASAGKKLKLPLEFIKVVHTKSVTSFVTEDMIKLNGRIRESLSEIYLMSNTIVSILLQEIRDLIGCLYKLAEVVSTLDFLLALAHVCTISDYVRPHFTDTMAIKNSRHPILEHIRNESVTPNNIYIDGEHNFLIITGPNMSGKSTYLKQVALLQVMAQIGTYIPAEFASFRITKQLFSRMGSNDDIETNCSTFGVEMREVNYILQNVSNDSLVIIDELGRGTSVEEGTSICYAICEYLLHLKTFTLLATHFLNVCQLDRRYPNVCNYHFEVQRTEMESGTNSKLHFTHVLAKGYTEEEHYGLKLAELSGLQKHVVDRAKIIAQTLEQRRNAMSKPSLEDARRKILHNLVSQLLQAARNSRLDPESLRAYLCRLQDQYRQELTCEMQEE